MLRILILPFCVALFGLVQAGEQQTVMLQVDNMTCGSCPFTVKMALKRVDGVIQVSAKYEGDGEGWAKVTFDSNRTAVKSLIRATTNAGYPSRLLLPRNSISQGGS